MHESATKCNKTVGKWCKNKHGASKIIDTLETYQYHLNMKKQRAPSHDKYSNKCSLFSSSLISLLGELYLDSSWEVAYFQLGVELYLMATLLVASHSLAFSSMGKIAHDALQSCT
jgi:hypothetical protein